MTALILIDLQNDFFPGGALAVQQGNEILPAINELIKLPFDLIVATQDWHPVEHESFAPHHHKPVGEVINLHGVQQVLWPIHCVQNTHGAKFAEGWDVSKVNKIIHKGTDPCVDSYSAFFDNELKCSTGLGLYLKEKGIHTVVIAGLATDYCVKFSVLDALKLGLKVVVVPEGCRGVNINPEDSKNALNEMTAAGATLATVEETKQYCHKKIPVRTES